MVSAAAVALAAAPVPPPAPVPAPASEGVPPGVAKLAKAKAAFDALNFAEASKAADAAWAADGNDRETVLDILKIQGTCYGILGQAERAKAAFRTLLAIAPDAQVNGDELGPKVTGPFKEAKKLAATDGTLKFEAGAPTMAGGKVVRLETRIGPDHLRLARTVRFNLRAPDEVWRSVDAEVIEGTASLDVELEAAEWWAELIGDHKRTLMLLGSEDKPLKAGQAKPVPVAKAKPPDLVGPGTQKPGPSVNKRLRPLAYASAGASAVAAAGGIWLGLQANAARDRIAHAEVDSDGRITGLTRVQALEIDKAQRTDATVANVLFGGAVAFAGVGVALYLMPGETTVVATPAGVSVAGVFP